MSVWTVGRFPSGDWTSGGKVSDPSYECCEVYLVAADNREQATRSAQGARRRLLKKNETLPTQSAPYRVGVNNKRGA